MAEPNKRPVTVQELLVSSLAQTDALAKLLIEKGLITREEFMEKISRGTGDVSEFDYWLIQTLVDRQCEYEPASFPDFALHPDPSPMQLDKLLGQR